MTRSRQSGILGSRKADVASRQWPRVERCVYRRRSQNSRSSHRRSFPSASKSPRDITPRSFLFSTIGMCRKPPSHISRSASIAVLFGDIVIGFEVMASASFVWLPSLPAANTRLTASRQSFLVKKGWKPLRYFGFHSLASRCASAICAGVILAATASRYKSELARSNHL